MAKKIIRTGTTADPIGDSLKNAFVKVNDNFTELYNALGLVTDITLNLGNFKFTGSTLSLDDPEDSTLGITIDTLVKINSDLSVGGDILPQTANGGDLGSSTLPWRSLYVSNNTIFLGGTALSVNGAGNLLVNGSLITGGTTSYNDLSDKPNLGTYATQNDINTVLNEIDTRVTTLSYNDLLDKPNLADTFSFNVAADDSTQRAISNNELIKFIGAGGITTSSDAEGNITINYVQGDIRSEGDINIDINLSDSTLRRWQFGEDGALTLPSVGKINNGAYDWTFGSTGNTTFPTGLTLGAPRGVGTVNFTAAVDKEFQIETGTATSGKLWQFGTDGNLTIPGDIKSSGNINIDINLSDSTLRRWSFGEDGFLNVAGPIVLPNNSELRPSSTAYDAALATWELNIAQFVRDRISLELVTEAGWPMATWYPTGVTAQGYIDFLLNAWTLQNTFGATLIIQPAISKSFYDEMRAALRAIRDTYNLYSAGVSLSSAYGKSWNFSETGDLTIPGSIRSDTGLYIDVNLADSTLRRWQFGEDGELTFPDGTNQTTAWTGSVAAGTLTGTALASGVVSSSLTSVGTLGTLRVTGGATAESFDTDQITIVGNRISTTVTNANLELECNGTGGVVINTVADATTASTVKSVGYLGLPQSGTSTSATLAIGDAGKHIYITTTGQTITIPAASSVAYPIGTTLTFIAGPSATTATIAIATDTLRLAGGTSTGSRTLAANGMATAVKVSGTSSAGVWYINGTGLT